MTRRILIAGIGNIFLGDDGFGVEVARLLAERAFPDGVQVMDAGIRGMDLAYALLDACDAVIMIDTVACGGTPGTLYLMEIEPGLGQDGQMTLDTHSMDPVKVLALARTLGAQPTRTFLIGCEPLVLSTGDAYDDVLVELSAPVRAALDEAVMMVVSLVEEIIGVPALSGVRPD